MGVCKCVLLSWQVGTLNGRRAASPRVVGGWETEVALEATTPPPLQSYNGLRAVNRKDSMRVRIPSAHGPKFMDLLVD
ncbi:hypothetical protein TNCV_2724581 [Trichonephila clavipes]|nr:hypothetical protein TNCV_2724581 [Trichonephila clavipes]